MSVQLKDIKIENLQGLSIGRLNILFPSSDTKKKAKKIKQPVSEEDDDKDDDEDKDQIIKDVKQLKAIIFSLTGRSSEDKL